MKHSDFAISKTFWCGGSPWRCTDIGIRTIAAIKLEHGDDPSWYNGPPYAVVEHVFDENDVSGCSFTRNGDPQDPRPGDPTDDVPGYPLLWQDMERCGGDVLMRNTRITAESIFDNCEGNDSDEHIAEMQDWFVGLTPEMIRQAIRYERERRGQRRG
jgi:uncharacterized protein (DUF433 family)